MEATLPLEADLEEPPDLIDLDVDAVLALPLDEVPDPATEAEAEAEDEADLEPLRSGRLGAMGTLATVGLGLNSGGGERGL